MTNITNATELMEINYNLTKILSSDIIDSPELFISNVNQALNGYMVIGLLVSIGVVLFLALSRRADSEPTQDLVYTLFILDIMAILLFFVSVVGGEKLITWGALLVFFALTFISIIIDKIYRNY